MTKHKQILATIAVATAITAGVHYLANQHIGPESAYPNSQYTPGLVATTDFNELNAVKDCGTYSACHRKTSQAEKTAICKEYAENCKEKVEIDHYCPLALGCADNIKNLWAEPEHIIVDGQDWGFHTKDKLENFMVIQMKAKKITPTDAQQCILKDWIACYKKYLGHKLGGIELPEDIDDEVIN